MGNKYILWGLVIVWMAVIFNLSSDNRDASSYKSKQVTAVVQQIASRITEDIGIVSSVRYISEYIVRKMGHILEYFLLTMLVNIASAISSKGRRRVFGNALIIPLLFAVSDELHQLYTPGRGPRITDVAIDGIGILTAICIAYGLTTMADIYRRCQGEKI
jgi:VanZ family protein